MTFIEKRNELRPATGAAPFSLDEVFFSRTDERGVIVAGNYVFRRVAHYDWARMLGAPHKIIRHPDMPRAVFWLLWDRLKQGRPVGAYVKNRASDGLHYWVFAVVAPCDGGFLSARIKPTSALRDRIEQEYAALRALEREEDLAPEASAATTASQPRSYSLNRIAKTKPEKDITAGKERSISPAPMMNVRPTARSRSGGRVDRKVV